MGYRLKDKELQRKLDELSGGDFSEQFKKNMRQIVNLVSVDSDVVIFFGKQPKLSVTIERRDLESTKRYTPNTWNAYPWVTPPENIFMRVETKSGRKFCASYRTFSDGSCWCHDNGTIMPETLSSSVIRFRPWED